MPPNFDAMFSLFRSQARLCLFAASALAATAVALHAPEAQACGGTFCDAGPTAMPVDQSGENVIFVMEPGSVEAHIQIQYDPETTAENFAWVIPVMSLPQFSVGSELFFDAVLNATVPRYGRQQNFDDCGMGTSLSTGFGSSTGDESSGEGSTGGDDGGGGGPTVVFEDTVGAFDIAVLSGGTIEEVMQWLADNGYQQDPAAQPILGEYLDEGFMFAAMKLTHTEGTDTIHPITLKMDTDEACVPLRLTAIAATEDMDVRTFFFGRDRVVPTNYRHVEVNPLKIDWVNNASNYKEVVTLAVDADGADGNAFVTEFAGEPSIPTFSFHSPGWAAVVGEAQAMVDTPLTLIQELDQAGLFWCDTDWQNECFAQHPLLDGLLAQYVPVPEGLSRAEFYSCLSCYEAVIDLEAWDAAAFAADLDDRIVKPAERAREIVESYPYVTRMYTTISGAEMNVDPIFRPNPDLEPVVATRIAQQQNHCNDTATMTLPDGREVFMPTQTEWPDIYPDDMPFEETVARGTLSGALMPVSDRKEDIDRLLARWNDGRPVNTLGCNCSSSGPAGGALMLVGLGLLGLSRRRRR